MTRDDWFIRGVDGLRPAFDAIGYPIPEKVRVSTGFPSKGAGAKNATIGQCFHGDGIADGIDQIYISPVLADPIRVLDVLVHELVHAAVGPGHGHKGPFRECALAIGLTGKMTATVAGPELAESLNTLATELGEYPHAELNLDSASKQKVRNILVTCEPCETKWRGSRTQIEKGIPFCGVCSERMTEKKGNDK